MVCCKVVTLKTPLTALVVLCVLNIGFRGTATFVPAGVIFAVPPVLVLRRFARLAVI
jgi:hypothetical protein